MTHFYASIQGSRGEATRTGTNASGIRTHARGWKAGASVECRAIGDIDVVCLDFTGGSNGGHARTPVAMLRQFPDGNREIHLDYNPTMVDAARRLLAEHTARTT